MSDETVHGPIDYLLLEFSEDRLTGGPAAALLDLVDAGIVRVYDLLVIRKATDGSIEGLDISDLDADSIGDFTVFAGARSGLLGNDDVAEAGDVMEPGTVAALLVYENTWAIPFVGAARDAGAELVASGRIPALDVMAALDDLEADDTTS